MPGLVLLGMIVGLVLVYVIYQGVFYESRVWPFVLVGVGILVGGIGWLVDDYYETETRTIIVEDKDRGGDDGSYRVYTDGDTLRVSDIWSPSMWRTNSADVFADVPVCHRLEVTVYGWELGLLSMMPNIVEWEDLGEVGYITPDGDCRAENDEDDN